MGNCGVTVCSRTGVVEVCVHTCGCAGPFMHTWSQSRERGQVSSRHSSPTFGDRVSLNLGCPP